MHNGNTHAFTIAKANFDGGTSYLSTAAMFGGYFVNANNYMYYGVFKSSTQAYFVGTVGQFVTSPVKTFTK